VVTEQFHEAVLSVFETLLWWGTRNAGKPVKDLIVESDFRRAAERCSETASNLQVFHETCGTLDVRDAVDGFAGWSLLVNRCRSEHELLIQLLDRHHQVQSGKVDGGMPKRDWIASDSSTLLRPSPRFQRNDRPSFAIGKSLTHPYRLEPFVYMLRENDVIPLK
jgi:hypothetical protein